MAIHLNTFGADKQARGLLPEHQNLLVQQQYNDTGVLTFKYAKGGANAGLLDADVLFLQPVIDGSARNQFFVLDDDQDETTEDGMMTCVARGVLAIFEQAVVYPDAHAPGKPVDGMDGEHAFTKQTPGTIFGTLIDRAKKRGALLSIDHSFSATADSNGVKWPENYSIAYSAGTDYLSALRDGADAGWFDMRMNGFVLELFVPGTQMARTTGHIIRTAKNVRQAPRKRSRRGIITHMLGVGAEKNLAEAANESAAARWGRREGSASDGRMTENGSLKALTQNALSQNSDTKEGFTVSLALEGNDPVPGRDYQVGDYIYWDERRLSLTEYEPLRVATLSWGQSGVDAEPTAEVELNDLFVESSIRLNRQMKGLNGGSVVNAPAPVQLPTDKTVPAPVSLVSLNAVVYAATDGHLVEVEVTWPVLQNNTDGTLYTDGADYLVQYTVNGGRTWVPAPAVTSNAASITALAPGAEFAARVAARDLAGNVGAWRASEVLVLPRDTEPPPVPSVPHLSARLGVISVKWDGLTFEGGPMPADFDHIDVAMGPAPAPVDLVGSMRTVSTIPITGQPYKETRYFRFRAVDRAGNPSRWSEDNSIAVVPLVDTDLIDKVIDGANIKDGTVNAAEAIIGETVTGDLVQGRTLRGGHLEVNTIQAENLDVGAVQAEHIALGVQQSNRIRNGGFEDTGSPVAFDGYRRDVPGWTMVPGNVDGSSVQYRSSAPFHSGNGTALLVNSGADAGGDGYLSDPFPVSPGEVLRASAWAACTAPYRTGLVLVLRWFNSAGAMIGATNAYEATSAANSTAWYQAAGNVTVPSGATTGRLYIQHRGAADGAGPVRSRTILCVDDVACIRIGTPAAEMTPSGIRMWNSAGEQTISIDGETSAMKFQTVEGELRITGNTRIDGTLSLPRGIIDNDALTSPVVPAVFSYEVAGHGISAGTWNTLSNYRINTPAGFSRAVVTASGVHKTVQNAQQNLTTFMYTYLAIGNSNGFQSLTTNAGYSSYMTGNNTHSALITGIADGWFTVRNMVWEPTRNYAANANNTAAVNGSILWLR